MTSHKKEIKLLWREYRRLIKLHSRKAKAGLHFTAEAALVRADKIKVRAQAFEVEEANSQSNANWDWNHFLNEHVLDTRDFGD